MKRVLLEVLFLLEDLAGRREDALLLHLVEELELLFDGDVRGQDRAHDLGFVERLPHPVLERPDVLERLAVREIFEPFTSLQVAPQDVEEGDDRMHFRGVGSGSLHERQERVAQRLQVRRRRLPSSASPPFPGVVPRRVRRKSTLSISSGESVFA